MIIYTYKCDACGQTMRDLSIGAKRHERCPAKGGKQGPYWTLDDIYIEGVDPVPTAKQPPSQA